jgi:hypothetical protein
MMVRSTSHFLSLAVRTTRFSSSLSESDSRSTKRLAGLATTFGFSSRTSSEPEPESLSLSELEPSAAQRRPRS